MAQQQEDAPQTEDEDVSEASGGGTTPPTSDLSHMIRAINILNVKVEILKLRVTKSERRQDENSKQISALRREIQELRRQIDREAVKEEEEEEEEEEVEEEEEEEEAKQRWTVHRGATVVLKSRNQEFMRQNNKSTKTIFVVRNKIWLRGPNQSQDGLTASHDYPAARWWARLCELVSSWTEILGVWIRQQNETKMAAPLQQNQEVLEFD